MKKFGTALNCMDGRVQIPVAEFLKNKYGLEFIDMITAPGINKILVEGDYKMVEYIKKCVEISIKNHKSELVAIAGHYDCAGNPSSNEIQIQQITCGINIIKSWNFNVRIAGLWLNENFNFLR
ncbi:MAG: carbonic anhydrase [Thermoanaerobaculia bacterium]